MRYYDTDPVIGRSIAEQTDRCTAEITDEGGWHTRQCSSLRTHGILCGQHARMKANGSFVSIPEDQGGAS